MLQNIELVQALCQRSSQSTSVLCSICLVWNFLALWFASARLAPPPRPAPCTKGQPIRTDLTAPLHNLTNYLYIYLIRLLPHSSAPLPSVSFSLSAPLCPEVNMISDPYPLLGHHWKTGNLMLKIFVSNTFLNKWSLF
jgi:hypothetical protein